jgi:serine/threonine protein kinase
MVAPKTEMKAIADYIISYECLGKGQYGIVHKAWKKGNENQLFACKIVEKKTLSSKLMQNLKNEVDLLKALNSD